MKLNVDFMRKKLTVKTIEALRPEAKRYEVCDTEMQGLRIRISSSGAKVFYYCKRVGGRAQRVKIGAYPAVSLSDARDAARIILRDIELQRFERPSERERIPTYAEVIEDFIRLYAKTHTKGWRESERLLKKFKPLMRRPIDEITRHEVVRILDEMVASGAPVGTNRALAAVKKMFNWCVDRGLITANPIAGLKPPTKERSRDRVLSAAELACAWTFAEDEGFPFGPLVQLLILTGQRRGEVAGMRWSEIDFEQARWVLPAGRVKNATQHVVPLSPCVMEILKAIPRFLGSDLVFTTNGQTAVSGFGRMKARLDYAVGANDWRIHDLRRTMATGMAASGVAPHIIEAVLNHKTGIVSGVAAIYNRHAYQDEKREALERWSRRLLEFSKNAGNSYARRRIPISG